MVLPLLYGLGARDFVDLQGYLLLTCQKCGASGLFVVYQAKRKVTFYSLPTVSVRDQLVVECRSCGQRFAVPAEMRDQFTERLLTEEEALNQLRRLGLGVPQGLGPGGGGGGGNGRAAPPTLYQTLQVDPAADPDVIEAAFRRLALKHHPDRSTDPESPTRMRAILEAKSVLLDEGQRRRYDGSIGIVRPPPPPPRPPRPPEQKPAPPKPPRPAGIRPEDV